MSDKKSSNAKKVENEVVSIDLQLYLVPISILLSGIMISCAVLFAMSKISTGGTSSSSDVPVAETAPETFADATVSTNDAPYLGDKSKAKIAIVEFSDFECPYCQLFHKETYEQIISEYVDSNKAIFVYKDYPLDFHQPVAGVASNAAHCAEAQGGADAYFSFSQSYYSKTQSNGAGLPSGTTVADLAKEAGVKNIEEFNTCVTQEKYKDAITAETAEGTSAGVSGTPGFIIGTLNDDGSVDGILVPGARSFEDFQTVIEEQLNK